MKKILFAILLINSICAYAQNTKTPTLKSILLSQLHSTHDVKEWFVPVNVAVDGLTPEQAKWTDGSGNHSVGQLANHLIFWNLQQLYQFKGMKPPAFNGNNDETFNSFDATNWKETVQRLDSVLTAIEKVVEQADDTALQKMADAIAHINTHNAYHIGQMIFVRKLQGAWDPEKGVK
ncbi:MAG: DinB family protein [Bacteroidetes bacterium]|nr:DinB family protein [Bacteroidota bacterium]